MRKFASDFGGDFYNGITKIMAEVPYPLILRQALVKNYFNNFDDKLLVARLNEFIIGRKVHHVRGVSKVDRERGIVTQPNFQNTIGWARMANPFNWLYLVTHTMKQSGLKLCDNLASSATSNKIGILNRIGNGVVKVVATIMKIAISLAFVVPDLAGYILAKPSNAVSEWISPFKDKNKNKIQPVDLGNDEMKGALSVAPTHHKGSSAKTYSALRVNVHNVKAQSTRPNLTESSPSFMLSITSSHDSSPSNPFPEPMRDAFFTPEMIIANRQL